MRVLLIAFVITGCGVADFDVTQTVPEQRITGSPLPAPLAALFPVPVNLDISAQITAMDTGPIHSVTLASLELPITATAQPMGDWSFIDEIDVSVSSSKSGSTLPTVKIAHVASPGKVTTLVFTIEDGADLKPYIDEGSVVNGASSGHAPPNDVTYDGNAVFTVHPV